MESELICFCASIISDIKDIAEFKKMIETYEKQTKTIKMYVSMSIVNNLEPIIESYSKKIPKHVNVIYTNTIKSIFEHYAILYRYIKINEKSMYKFKYVLFSENNTLWDISRVETYYDIFSELQKLKNKEVMCIRVFNNNRQFNYLDYCINILLLQDFIAKVTSSILKHKFCDMILCKYLNSLEGDNIIFATNNDLIQKKQLTTQDYVYNCNMCNITQYIDIAEYICSYICSLSVNKIFNEHECIAFVSEKLQISLNESRDIIMSIMKDMDIQLFLNSPLATYD